MLTTAFLVFSISSQDIKDIERCKLDNFLGVQIVQAEILQSIICVLYECALNLGNTVNYLAMEPASLYHDTNMCASRMSPMSCDPTPPEPSKTSFSTPKSYGTIRMRMYIYLTSTTSLSVKIVAVALCPDGGRMRTKRAHGGVNLR